MPARPTVVLDCRWLGISGAGRTTELLLRGLAEHRREGRWLLWGRPDLVGPLAWPGTTLAPVAEDPRTLLGQRHGLGVPQGDLTVFMHQQRPLRRLPALTVIHDTIPLRHGGSRAGRRAKGAFLRRVARISDRVVTVSEYSKRCIVDDLRFPAARVDVLRFPFDPDLVARVSARRRHEHRSDVALYVGNFLPHKNLPRLVAGFEASRFRAEGGRLVLAGGGRRPWVDALVASLTPGQRAFVTLAPDCSQYDLDGLMATALFVVQPSLDEGFGLPAWEALCCGLPVCASDAGALPELVDLAGGEGVVSFPAAVTTAMTAAIDACAAMARGRDDQESLRASQRVRGLAPTIAAFGAHFTAIVEAALRRQ